MRPTTGFLGIDRRLPGLTSREPLDDTQLRAFEAFHDEARVLDAVERLAQEVILFEEDGKGIEVHSAAAARAEGGSGRALIGAEDRQDARHAPPPSRPGDRPRWCRARASRP